MSKAETMLVGNNRCSFDIKGSNKCQENVLSSCVTSPMLCSSMCSISPFSYGSHFLFYFGSHLRLVFLLTLLSVVLNYYQLHFVALLYPLLLIALMCIYILFYVYFSTAPWVPVILWTMMSIGWLQIGFLHHQAATLSGVSPTLPRQCGTDWTQPISGLMLTTHWRCGGTSCSAKRQDGSKHWERYANLWKHKISTTQPKKFTFWTTISLDCNLSGLSHTRHLWIKVLPQCDCAVTSKTHLVCLHGRSLNTTSPWELLPVSP